MQLFSADRLRQIASGDGLSGGRRRVALLSITVLMVVALAVGLTAPVWGAATSSPMVGQQSALETEAAAVPGEAPQGRVGAANADKAWLGILIGNSDGGVKVLRVILDSPAAKAGVKKDDLITSVNGVNVVNANDVISQVQKNKPGDQVTLTIKRGNDQVQIAVAAGAYGAGQARQLASPGLPPELQGLQGLPLREMFGSFAGGTFKMKDKEGKLLVINVVPGTVVAATATSLTIDPNDDGPTQEFQVSASTMLVGTNGRVKVEDLKAEDRVLVVTVGDGAQASIIARVGAAYNPLEDLVPQLRVPRLWSMPEMQPFRNWQQHFDRPEPKPNS